ncbi:PQQ-binding-like beta-propeller repeat protein [Streptomyces sp. FH025]|uniref:outer membrane protein assembly factor BamB family protein n=1 Tax=Streptomyces sp. FH025 TaxID=2815937 RepID=UPI001A9E4BCB|nr:PQQ-binding-like beta-propeller repeat protein [Streptomyces sp. FH025]MBO1416475.1 PQQ-binding-like beta-propeller repeat protein [Streptomyces sp. FH025]
MAQEPFGDPNAQQQPWYPQDHQGGYYGQPQQQPPSQPQAQWPQEGYGPVEYGQPEWSYGQGGYGPTGYTEGGYVEAGYVEGPYGEQGRYQPYQQPYPPYAAEQKPAQEGLYVPAGAEYSADGYVHDGSVYDGSVHDDSVHDGSVHLEDSEPAPEAAAEQPPAEPSSGSGPAASSRAAARRGRGGGAGSGGSLAARARAAADAVLTGEHVPSRRALLVRAGAGVAALGVLIAAALTVGAEGGGSAAATGGGEPGFAVAHTKVWSAQAAGAGQGGKTGGDDTLVGSWLLADAVVRADGSGVHAYDRTEGKPTWTVEPPAAGAVPCGLSAGVNQSGLGAALFRPQPDPKSPCTLVAAVDTKTGKTAWTKTLSDAKDSYGARIGVTEDKVIAIGDDRVMAWESAEGKDVWQYTGQGRFCTLSGGVTGKTVLVASTCADSTPADQAVALNTVDGKVAWWRGLNNQPKTVTVLSAEPAVVLTTGGKPEDDRVFAWGAAGDPAAEIPVVADGGRLDVSHGAFSATPEVFFAGRTMAAVLAPGNGGGPVSAVGYDLDTGKQRWKAPVAAKGTVRAVGIDGGSLVIAADERRDQLAHLTRFPLAGGQEAVGGNFPPGTGALLVAGRVAIGDGQVVVLPEHSANYGTAAGYRAKG